MAVVATVLVFAIMPQQWFDRMATVTTYEQDASAMGRINAWHMAFNMAKAKFLGGGFDAFQPGTFAAYAPDPDNVHDSHSIYFEVLGEHGFVGLALFLLLGLATWRTASWVIKHARRDPEKRWAADLAAMIQVSLVGYATAGAFLGLAYFDYYYTLIAVVVLCKTVLISQQETRQAEPDKNAARWSAADARRAKAAGDLAGLGSSPSDRMRTYPNQGMRSRGFNFQSIVRPTGRYGVVKSAPAFPSSIPRNRAGIGSLAVHPSNSACLRRPRCQKVENPFRRCDDWPSAS